MPIFMVPKKCTFRFVKSVHFVLPIIIFAGFFVYCDEKKGAL